MNNLSASLEDYLEIISNNINTGTNLRAIDISKQMKVSRASVTEALKKLTSKGYINYDRYEMLSLTQKGKEIADKIVSKHIILQRFFEEKLGLSSEEASINACKIEHVITDNAFNQIAKYIKE